MSSLVGAVERIVFHNADTGFTVARFHLSESAHRGEQAVSIVGTMPTVRAGEMLRLVGEWEVHPVHGRNFRVTAFEPTLPESSEGIERYLASGAVRGIGPVTASRIVDCFGSDTMTVIDAHPESLRKIAGISAKRLEVIKESWAEHKNVRDIMMFLQEHDVSVTLATRVYAAYGAEALDRIREDPFRLAQDIHGVGFRTADGLARRLGMPLHSVSRYVAGLRHVLTEGADEGHVFLPRDEVMDRATQLLDAQKVLLEPALLELIRLDLAVLDADKLYLSAFHHAESGAASHIQRILTAPSCVATERDFDARAITESAAAEQGLALADKQEKAVEQALWSKVSVLTGGPGTGKTSTLRTIITALEAIDATYCLCAPTGRAAKRAAEAAGRPASTIHRLLEYQPGGSNFGYDTSRQLPYDFVIVDEVSMLDIVLFYHLLKAIASESHVLLVGDADQLPSVGPGNVLHDVISSGAVPTVELTELFRQVRGSQIVLAAHAVNEGRLPEFANGADDDLFFVRAEQEDQAVEAIRRLVTERIPRKFGFDPIDDVQVVSPMHMGPAGVANLNGVLQGALNPPTPGVSEIRRGDRLYRIGDKVMQVRNNYDKDVFNGDVGKIVDIDTEDQMCMVAYVTAGIEQHVAYEGTELEELALAYAVSIHKAQGSEFPCLVLPLLPRHHMLLQRTVLYTAITRARQLCVIVGSPRALRTAIQTDRRQTRNTDLARRLSEVHPPRLHLDAV